MEYNNNIFDSFQYLNWLNTICALPSYDIKRTGISILVKLNSRFYYYFKILLTVTVLSVSDIMNNEKTFLRAAQSSFNAQTVNICIIAIFIKRHGISKMLFHVLELHKELRQSGYQFHADCSKKIGAILLGINLLLNFAMAIRYFVQYTNESIPMVVIYYFGGITFTLQCSYFVMYASLINQNLEFIVAVLDKKIADNGLNLPSITNLRKFYAEIWKCIKMLNCNYNVLLLCVFAHGFLNSTNAVYFWLRGLNTGSFNLFEAILWNVLNIGRLIVVATVCDFAKTQVSIKVSLKNVCQM